MTTEFAIGMFKKVYVKNGYLIIDKGKTPVKLADITSAAIVKKSVVINGNNVRLATISGLSPQTAFELIEFINAQRAKSHPDAAPAKPRRGKIKQFFLTVFLVIIIVAIIVAVYFMITTP